MNLIANRNRAACTTGLGVFAILFAIHCVHLTADFPNYSPWMDYSKYTDEGWYSSAAVRQILTGHWYAAGDFNPAVALPVWPVLVWLLFHFTGPSLIALRALTLAVYAASLLLCYKLIRTEAPAWAAVVCVAILLTNTYLYSFTRLGLLEPLMILLVLSSWRLALALQQHPRSRLLPIAVGLCLCLAILAKTTAVFLVPSTLLAAWAAGGWSLRRAAGAMGWIVATAAGSWTAYYLLLVHPRYQEDFRYFFEANQWPQPTTAPGWVWSFWHALHGLLWVDPLLCCLVALLLLAEAVFVRSLWRRPLVSAALLAVLAPVLFCGWHNNEQPRYYLVAVYGLAILVALGLAELRAAASAGGWGNPAPWSAVAAAGILGVCLGGNLWRTVAYAIHPQYTFVTAVDSLARTIRQDPARNPLLLSISGGDVSLMAQLPAICDDFGTWDLPRRIRTYRPGWYAAWNQIDPPTQAQIEAQYRMQKVAEFSAFDDPDRNLLILYRLEPIAPSARAAAR